MCSHFSYSHYLGKTQGSVFLMLLLLLLLLFAWPQVCLVCPKHNMVRFQPPTGTAPDIVSVTLTNITFSGHLPPNLFQIFQDISPPLHPLILLLLLPPSSAHLRRFTISLHLISPQLARAQSGATIHLDGAPLRRPPPL